MIRFIAYVWLGLVLGVSFLATPVKFRAKSLTRPVALDVGRTTFHAFGKLEWVFSLVLVVITVQVRDSLEPVDWFLVALVLVIVVGQALWLIPRLDVRVAAIIAGEEVSRSHLHSVYAGAEFVKALALLLLGAWTAGHV
ncbi:MAG: DUF4149 domain-containing protein [Acidimicrobiaceae bacterium]|nr:DUF4149 domain-containing protein [Acidimicrobiaceae bacterium]